MFEVRVGEAAAEKITRTYGPERSGAGRPSEWDFWSGPLAAALIGFRDFESLLFGLHPEIRTLHIVDPVFGALVFAGVLVEPGVVEIAEGTAQCPLGKSFDATMMWVRASPPCLGPAYGHVDARHLGAAGAGLTGGASCRRQRDGVPESARDARRAGRSAAASFCVGPRVRRRATRRPGAPLRDKAGDLLPTGTGVLVEQESVSYLEFVPSRET